MLLKMMYAFFWQEGIFKGDWSVRKVPIKSAVT